MAKTSGLNTRLYVEGYDLSGDANALSGMGYSNSLYDTTTLDVSAAKRIIGPVEGTLTVNGWFDNRSGGIHPVFTSNSGKLPTGDQNVLVPMGSAVGDPSLALLAKEADYSVDRAQGSAISVTSNFSSTGNGPEFGVMMTAFADTHSSAGSGTVIDSGASSSNGGAGILQLFSLLNCRSSRSANSRKVDDVRHCSTIYQSGNDGNIF
jgi:hypothetical protein